MEIRRRGAYRELEQRVAREETMAAVVSKLQTQRNLMGKGRRSKVGLLLARKEFLFQLNIIVFSLKVDAGKKRSGDDGDDDNGEAKKAPVYRWRKERQR
jgi:hypothetical protein